MMGKYNTLREVPLFQKDQSICSSLSWVELELEPPYLAMWYFYLRVIKIK